MAKTRSTAPKKVKARPTPPKRDAQSSPEDLERAVRALERRLKQLAADHEQARAKWERQLAAAKRVADRRMTAMLRELTMLRHHEARANAFERMLAERDALIAALRADRPAAASIPAAPVSGAESSL